jgi:hypothetical protein
MQSMCLGSADIYFMSRIYADLIVLYCGATFTIIHILLLMNLYYGAILSTSMCFLLWQ